MGFLKVAKLALSAVVIATLFGSVASAQPFQKPLRWLGEGFSAGYHRCNPGPDADYYNPWNAHNSMLIHKLPQFQNETFQSYNMTNLGSRPIYRGVPYSVYAAPQSQYNHGHGYGYGGAHGIPSPYNTSNQSGYGAGSGDSVESSFEPYDMKDEENNADTSADEEWIEDEDEWDEDEDEWNDDENDEASDWKDGSDDDIEDDSARIQAPIPGNSVFSKASFRNQPPSPSYPADSNQNLFNPFPRN